MPLRSQFPLFVFAARRIILVRCAGVEDMLVADKLNVSGVQDHVQRFSLARLLEDLHGVQLCFGERRELRVGARVEPPERRHVVRIKLAVQPRRSLGVILEVEDSRLHPRLLACRHLALAIRIPDRLAEQPGHFGMLSLQAVEDAMLRADIRLAALHRLGHAEQPDDVARVGVEELPRVGPINADAVCLRRVLAEVLDVAQDVSAAVLAHKVAQVRAQTHISGGRLLQAPLLDGQVLEEPEALAVDELFAEVLH